MFSPRPAYCTATPTRQAWLESTLQNSTADFLIVAGHFPIYSVCEHGPTVPLISSLKPMLEHYNVTAYLAGHDHCMEYINTGTGLDHHGIGSAHINSPSEQHKNAVPAGSLRWYSQGTGGGFASFLVTAEGGMVVRHHDGAAGDIVFTAPPHATRPAGPYPPLPPAPAPPSPAPPAPTPAGMSWECHSESMLDKSSYSALGITDTDIKSSGTIASCEALGNGLNPQGCSVVMFHKPDGHCHTLCGKATDHAAVIKDLVTDKDHTLCVLVSSSV